jgi:transcriptional regulator with XRE-family HTH domain
LSSSQFATIFESVDTEHHQLLAALGQAIHAIREEQGLSTRDLSVASGVAEASIVAVEDGRVDPSFELLLGLARGLGVRPAELFTRAEALGGRPRGTAGGR